MQSLQYVQRPYKQIQILSSHPCVPRPNAAAVISPIPKQEKTAHQHVSLETRVTFSTNLAHATKRPEKHDEEELLHCMFLGFSGQSSAHTVTTERGTPCTVSLEPRT